MRDAPSSQLWNCCEFNDSSHWMRAPTVVFTPGGGVIATVRLSMPCVVHRRTLGTTDCLQPAMLGAEPARSPTA